MRDKKEEEAGSFPDSFGNAYQFAQCCVHSRHFSYRQELKCSVQCSLLALSRFPQLREVSISVFVFSYMTKIIQKCENEREV